MVKYTAFVLMLLVAMTAEVVAQGRPPVIPPKKPKGSHSNGNGPHRPPPGLQGGGIAPLFSHNGFDDPDMDFNDGTGTVPGKKGGLSPVIIGSNFMTPSGWGSTETFVFGAVSGTPAQSYSTSNPDLIGQVGFGAGNAKKLVSVIGVLNINDLSKFDNFSASFIASRQLGQLNSISVGALHLFADPYKTDAGESFYIAYSQAIRKTRFSYTVGVGTGRFYDNNEYDIKAGKAEHGTAVFANLSYNICRSVGVSAEWTGRNLAFSTTIQIKTYLPVVAFGVTDLTRFSGDHPVFFASIGKGFVFNRRK